ncbi:MAG: Acyl-CoA dehydrogenase, short-chain specific, partial [uncultured Gemmatimonadetes bacterium]
GTVLRREPPDDPRHGARVRHQRDRPGRGGDGPEVGVPLGERQEDGRAGPPGRALGGGAGRGGDGRDRLHDHHPRAGPGGRVARHHRVRPHHAGHVAHHDLRHAGAEGALRPAPGQRAGAGRLRAHRAGRRVGRGRHADHRREGGRRVAAEWQQDLHHTRGRRRGVRGHRRDGPREGVQGYHLLHRHQAHDGPGARPGAGGRPLGRAGVHRRGAGGEEGRQDGVEGFGHAGAGVRGRVRAGRERAGGARDGLHQLHEDAGRRPHRHRRAVARDRRGRVRAGGEVRQRAQAVRQVDRGVPGPAVHAGRHGYRDRSRQAPGLQRRVAQGAGEALLQGSVDGQALRLRGRHARDHEGGTGARRVRLHEGISGGAHDARRQDLRDRGGHQRDPAHGDRAPHPPRAQRL